MCRLLVFSGVDPIQLCHLITNPAHSIINQAFDARLRLDRTRSVNGDGFGLGWYSESLKKNASIAEKEELLESDTSPCIFTSVTPAWNNQNLQRLAEKIKSPLVFAHVRASTSGALSETNCHPWRYGRLMFMHNGQISGFAKIKRKIVETLPDELFLFIQGSTDSEYAFAVFLSHVNNRNSSSQFDYNELRRAMLKTIEDLNRWEREAGVQEPSLLNFAVTDGCSVVCSRYVSSRTEEAASLYFSSGTSFYEYEPSSYRMVKEDRREKIVVVASEPLTFEKADWMEIQTNTIVCVTPRLNVLTSPIEDENLLPPSEAHLRSPAFATRIGYPPNTSISSVVASASSSALSTAGSTTVEVSSPPKNPIST